ncbi:chaperonin 10-like protein [Microdochium trichocladiopsis]|uniref:Chaperonin 10-like protein n=1 Tax=Microdochium trichocladiopsis TaxID=1682393 RepID=A0A9P8XSN0_9PEZI|nr:chaperonin 10-like protein [Microdochium trichocladiopsis]XP_046005724.1 chaperonin 10-like protein [Microdochium trichocladiopsis]KAH7014647.1 chaperonin 10-like protein [Microdochium trichocladiopsis]KAH7016100.1 chaperonin 10-like protein [Microdochium trichocladiopsis]
MSLDTNRKVLISRAGGPDRLQLVDAPMPAYGADEVLIRIEAVGVAFADVLIREGLYPDVPLPATPGYEVVGLVVSKGEQVTSVDIGARVAALTIHGGYAKYLNVSAASVVAVPPSLKSPAAASLVLNGLTAYQMLTRCVALDSTQSILVWGAAGGVGSILLDLARHFGITAYGVASGSRLDFVAEKGAIPINRSEGDVASILKQHAPAGVDAVFDGVGGPNVAVSQRCLNEGGTVVLFGVQGGFVGGRRSLVRLIRTYLASSSTALSIFLSNRGLKGYVITPWFRQFPDRYKADLSNIFTLAAKGSISPQIDVVLPLSRVAEAHQRINAGSQLGKIILDPTC